MRQKFNFICLHVPTPFVEDYYVFLISLSKLITKCISLFLDSQLDSTGINVLLPVPHSLDYCSFVVSLEIRKCESFNFAHFFLQDCFYLFMPLAFPYEFKDHFIYFCPRKGTRELYKD
jgi:hypothetical protein